MLAAHLLNRTGFGPLPAEIDQAVKDGVETTVTRLVSPENEGTDFPLPNTPEIPDQPRREFSGLSAEERRKKMEELQRANRESVDDIRKWWISRMRRSRWPLREKMVLFWHGHFTSSVQEVKAARLMFNQNAFFRKNCFADFRTLLVGISQDPAMLRYLDNNTNRKEHPNENYARELLELFTMGIGNYSEEDVKDAARAFTGWTFEGEDFVFREGHHDFGRKTFLGETGRFDGEDIIDIILLQPCTAIFMANKLLKYFVTDHPPTEMVEAVAAQLRKTGYKFKPVLQTLFQSQYFYSTEVYRTQIKSPAQLVVGSARLLDIAIDERALAISMRGLGQDLLAPPNVNGWEAGESWINTTTLLLRYNFAGFLLSGQVPAAVSQRSRARLNRLGKPKNQLADLLSPEVVDNPARLVDVLVARLLQTKLDAKARQWLVEQAETSRLSDRVVRVAHLIMSMPDYQLC
ncbi:MAG: hypothetical protein PCFJNLEI_04026 [Verrucomicrobiae bacterium]|nr:hypothetical protein [Verrucomicrobiae bacterium]